MGFEPMTLITQNITLNENYENLDFTHSRTNLLETNEGNLISQSVRTLFRNIQYFPFVPQRPLVTAMRLFRVTNRNPYTKTYKSSCCESNTGRKKSNPTLSQL